MSCRETIDWTASLAADHKLDNETNSKNPRTTNEEVQDIDVRRRVAVGLCFCRSTRNEESVDLLYATSRSIRPKGRIPARFWAARIKRDQVFLIKVARVPPRTTKSREELLVHWENSCLLPFASIGNQFRSPRPRYRTEFKPLRTVLSRRMKLVHVFHSESKEKT